MEFVSERLTVIKNPSDILEFLEPYKNCKVEKFGVLCLDGQHQVIAKKVLFIGGYTSSTIDIKVLLRYALIKRSCAIVIFHNHPSGVPTPSKDDADTTKEINKGCKAVGINLLDHIIIGRYGYYSFLEHDVTF